MKKLLIIGNSGAGKTWLSEKIAGTVGVQTTNLDEIFWQDSSFSEIRNIISQKELVSKVLVQPEWIVEGVFGDLAEMFIPATECLIFLDLQWEACEVNLLNRTKGNTEQAVNSDINTLLMWASEYKNRETSVSHSYHNRLFNNFKGTKYKLSSTQEIESFKINKKC
jgi:adenylate kinase family enzyme